MNLAMILCTFSFFRVTSNYLQSYLLKINSEKKINFKFSSTKYLFVFINQYWRDKLINLIEDKYYIPIHIMD